MEDIIVPIVVVPILFIGLPWLIFHYITRWKSQATLTREDEQLLDELHEMARRLDDRMCSIERIMTAENPNWRSVGCDPITDALEERRPSSFSDAGTSGSSFGESQSVSNQPRRIGQ
ncbi:envelope stress response membrane protein PspB [Sphingosinicella sp. BN140058]|uniref:envelope stress response membrane protein PspB n=1 Tax=Sphingosinicella sp. BN140058 TaxID=1892855 RepID=UPI00101037C5|nr:envelope stress response membrane protein PspB [Sphingosinicella sp. BN140058]QAY78641.1 envelope stress response membrane protein PspB [Sphingosinicella sp. BN140058]